MSYQAVEDEEKPFLSVISLPLDAERNDTPEPAHHDTRQQSSRSILKGGLIAAFAVLQIILIAIYTSVYLSLSRCTQSSLEPASHLQPGKSPHDISNITYEWRLKKFTMNQDSPYIGDPSPSTEAAWDHLLENMTIRVTAEEVKRAGKNRSVQLPGGGHMAWLGVHHELHCIKYVREWMYRDYYFPQGTEAEIKHRTVHADHCIEMLRSAAMCRADTTLTTFHWETQTKPMLDLQRVEHVCVDWETLKESVAHRIVSREESLQLKNPNLQTTTP